jgi:hypothetical protein
MDFFFLSNAVEICRSMFRSDRHATPAEKHLEDVMLIQMEGDRFEELLSEMESDSEFGSELERFRANTPYIAAREFTEAANTAICKLDRETRESMVFWLVAQVHARNYVERMSEKAAAKVQQEAAELDAVSIH